MTFNLNFQTLSAYHATRELVPGVDTAKLAGNVIALPTPAFWKAWNADAEKLSTAGYTVAHYRSNFCVLVPIGGTLEAPAPVKISTPIEVTTALGIRYAYQRIDAENLHPLTACFLRQAQRGKRRIARVLVPGNFCVYAALQEKPADLRNVPELLTYVEFYGHYPLCPQPIRLDAIPDTLKGDVNALIKLDLLAKVPTRDGGWALKRPLGFCRLYGQPAAWADLSAGERAAAANNSAQDFYRREGRYPQPEQPCASIVS